MAFFTSTTSSGYSDPLKAMSIKALEARQKEMASQPGDVITPENTQTPMQGVAHVFNQLGDSMAQGRVMSAAAEQRERFAQTIAHMDVNNPKPEDLAVISTTDPETFRQMLTMLAENRRAAAQIEATKRGQDLTAQGVKEGHQVQHEGQVSAAASASEGHEVTREGNKLTDTRQRDIENQQVEAAKQAAAQLAKTQQEAADADLERERKKPSTQPIAQINQAVANNQMTPKEGEDAKAKLLQQSAADIDKQTARKIESGEQQVALNGLDEAVSLLDSKKGIIAGRGAGFKTGVGEYLSPTWGGPDDEVLANTKRFNTIMGEAGLQKLMQMKGASTDADVQINFKLANDPTSTPDVKKKAIATLKSRLAFHLQANNEAIAAAGGEAPVVAQPNPVTTLKPEEITQSQANAKAAVASGKWTREQANARLKAAGVPGI